MPYRIINRSLIDRVIAHDKEATLNIRQRSFMIIGATAHACVTSPLPSSSPLVSECHWRHCAPDIFSAIKMYCDVFVQDYDKSFPLSSMSPQMISISTGLLAALCTLLARCYCYYYRLQHPAVSFALSNTSSKCIAMYGHHRAAKSRLLMTSGMT